MDVIGACRRTARRRSEEELATLSQKGRLRIHEDAELLKLVTYLERISVRRFMGGFDPSFLELPDEILITVMRGHQKYFARGEARTACWRRISLAVINLDKDRERTDASRGTRRCCARALRMRSSSGSPTRNVGWPTICRSLSA